MSWIECRLGEEGVLRRATRGRWRHSSTLLKSASPSRLFARSGFALLCVLIGLGGRTPAAQEADFSSYARAADYCRGDVARPIALSQAKHVLCLDGAIPSGLSVSIAVDWADDGIPVVRSRGGDAERAVQYQPCLSALSGQVRGSSMQSQCDWA